MEQIILNGHVYLSGWLSGCVCGVRLLIFRHWEAIRFPAADKKKRKRSTDTVAKQMALFLTCCQVLPAKLIGNAQQNRQTLRD